MGGYLHVISMLVPDGEPRNRHEVRPGDTVIYRDPVDGTRTHMAEHLDSGMKNDQPIWNLGDGHWCYESQIVRVVPRKEGGRE